MTEPAGIAARWQALTSLAYPDNYPTDETLATLFDEMDFQRACQCYIWAMPRVALNEINVAQTEVLGVQMNEIALFQDFVGPESIGLTPNNTTIYALGVVDLASAGPMVVDIPEGAYGAIDDYWQRPVVEVGAFGPDQGKGGTFSSCRLPSKATCQPVTTPPLPSPTGLSSCCARSSRMTMSRAR